MTASCFTTWKPKSKLKFVTLDQESHVNALSRREAFLRICSQEDLAEKAHEIEVTIPVTRVKKISQSSVLFHRSFLR